MVVANIPVCVAVGAVIATLGMVVSMGTVINADAVFGFPAASVAISAGSLMVTLATELASGVIFKENAVPEPVKLVAVPPVIIKSPAAIPTIASVKVTLATNAPVCVVVGADIETPGTMVSMAMTACVAAVLGLPTASVAALLGKSMVTLVEEFALGVMLSV